MSFILFLISSLSSSETKSILFKHTITSILLYSHKTKNLFNRSKFISGFLTAKTINANETLATVGLTSSDVLLCISSITPFPFSICIVTLSPTIGFMSLCLNFPLALHSIKPSSVLI